MAETEVLRSDQIADRLLDGVVLKESAVCLELGDYVLRIRSDSGVLLEQLRDYFAHVLTTGGPDPVEVIVAERPVVDLPIAFADWPREAGKTGRKDSFADLPRLRLVRKIRTGMLFLQSNTSRIAAGPCLVHLNQVINFINSQYMNWLQQRHWLLCHAAALVRGDQALAIAGLSGGGKSTLMLRMLENESCSYLTNDRLLIHRSANGIQACGIPKLPRINPGTIVGNHRLHSLVKPEKLGTWKALSPDELWDLEEKHDVPIADMYGVKRIQQKAQLGAFLILNWQRGGDLPVEVQRVSLENRSDLLAAIMKSPGPFYQRRGGSFLPPSHSLDTLAYRSMLKDVPLYEASGSVDFDQLKKLALQLPLEPAR